MKPMRLVFGETLIELAEEFPKMVVLDSDVSSSTQTKLFGMKYPDRFFNFGIAESNMISAAAGMAACGQIPVASTFAFLITLKAADPVHSLVAYNNLNVKLAGGYAGLSDFADGASHQSVMDLAIMRSMPNMTVLIPSDIETTIGATREMLKHNGPVYIRLSRDLAGSYHNGNRNFEIGRANLLVNGKDLLIAVCGTLTGYALEASEQLNKRGISTSVIEFPTLKPFDIETLLKNSKEVKGIITVEEHSILGGLGSAVCECVCDQFPKPVKRVGIKDMFGQSGKYKQLLDEYMLTTPAIIRKAEELLVQNKSI